MKTSLWIACVLQVLSAGAALADPRELKFGALTLNYDDREWNIFPSEHVWQLTRVNQRIYVPLRLETRALGHATCDALAKAQLPERLYYQHKRSEITVAGLVSAKVTSWTGCRNLTPLGVAVCIPHKGMAHLVTATIPSCQQPGQSITSEETVESLLGKISLAP